MAEVEKRRIEASLGHYLYKKRVARSGQGKRGSYRTILAFKKEQRLFFLFGFDKGAKDNISKKEKDVLKKLSKELMGYVDSALEKSAKTGFLIKVECENEQDN